ncbi:MAG: HECT domain-containing protein [archaeon]|nr:HECT domain-containing protein [archaeon]
MVINSIKEIGIEKLKCIEWNISKIRNMFSPILKDGYSETPELISFKNGRIQFPLLEIDLKKLSMLHSDEKKEGKLCKFGENLKDIILLISSLHSLLLKEKKEKGAEEYINLKDDFSINIVSVLFNFTMTSLFYIVSHPNFTLAKSEEKLLMDFFDFVIKIRSLAKKVASEIIPNDSGLEKKKIILEGITSSFKNLTNEEGIFNRTIENCQNFLTLILFSIGSNQDEEEEEESEVDQNLVKMLYNFTKSLNIFYRVNKSLKLIPENDFLNDGLSKHLNFRRECQVYNQILSKNYSGKKPFSLITYIWLFDPAAKSEILREFNKKKQSHEVFNSVMGQRDRLLEGGLGGLGGIGGLGRMMPIMINAESIHFMVKVHREKLIEDTLNIVANPNINFQKPLKVKFIGEQGIDEGGVRKEFFMLLVRQLFDVNYGMFNYRTSSRIFWFNLFSFEPSMKYELIGIILGLALFNNIILDVKFPLVIYKKLLGCPLTIEDMKECDTDLYHTLSFLLKSEDPNLEEVVSSNFTVTVDKFGEAVEIPLKANGANIPITYQNKNEYVDLYLDWYFNKSIEKYFVSFQKGFFRVVDKKLSHLVKPEELELIICGTQTLDFHELQRVARYEDGYDKNSAAIKWFWEVLHTFNEEEKKKFLFFVSGCDRAPINGLGSLEIIISRFGPDSDKLPCSHTCFNHLLLPDYANKEKLARCLHIAINNAEGFGLQ